MNSNITYQTDQIARYFAQNRVTWPQFYDSERVIMQQLNLGSRHEILDIGCGCGGLGLALRERFGVEDYTGVEINSQAAEAARLLNSRAHILCGDILDLGRQELSEKKYHVVFSLSCVDWNVEFADMLDAAWTHVLPGGHLVATFRLTEGESCNDMTRSYQYINFDGAMEGERAAYVVLNANVLIQQLKVFDPNEIRAFGYWGAPSATAVTPYDRLCFSAFSIQKRSADQMGATRFSLDMPAEILAAIGAR